MPEPTAELQALRASTADLLKGLEEEHWSDDDLTTESLCAGWTRGHMLTHLARNADGITATLSGALRGEIVPRYPDGPGSRDRDIEAGAGRPLAEQLADVAESAGRLDRVLAAMKDAGDWDAATDLDSAAHEWVWRRFREVEIHRVDLAGVYTPDRWPPELVSSELPGVAETLGTRTDRALRVEVTAEGSITQDLPGRTWSVGDGDPLEVSGPDWAIYAWLIGRGPVARDALTAMPELGDRA